MALIDSNLLSIAVNIPKSKTFVRDSNGNNTTGSRSQQPVPASEASQPLTPASSLPPPPLSINEKTGSQTNRREKGLQYF